MNVAIFVSLAIGAPAVAQYSPPIPLNYNVQQTFVQSAVGNMITSNVLARQNKDAGEGRGNEASSASAANQDTPRLAFTPSPTRRRTNLAQFVAKSRSSDPQGAAAMEALFAHGDFIQAMGRQLAPLGLRIDDLADAYAVYWVSAWQAAHRDTRTIERATMAATRDQAARALTATPEIAAANDAQKQEFAEALLVQAALIGAMQNKYGDDAKLGLQIAAAVRQGAKASGLDLDAMTLTEEGFVPARKVGDATPHKASVSPLLLAAAGGAGLGAVFLLGKVAGRRG